MYFVQIMCEFFEQHQQMPKLKIGKQKRSAYASPHAVADHKYGLFKLYTIPDRYHYSTQSSTHP